MSGLEAEGMGFLEAVLAGMIVYCAYTCIRKFRRVVKHNLIAIAIEDMIFWLGAAVYLFVQIYHTSDGSIRWYFILGVVLGLVFTAQVERIMKKIDKKMYAKKKNKSGKSIEQMPEKR